METQWYCNLSGQQLGPLSSEQLRLMARAGRLTPEDQVKQAGAGAWVRAGQLSGLFPGLRGLADSQPAVSVRHPSMPVPPEPPQLPRIDPSDNPIASDSAPLDFLADAALTVAGKTRSLTGSRTAEAVKRQKYSMLIAAMAAAAAALAITTVVLVIATNDSGGVGADAATTMPSPAAGPVPVPSKDIRPAVVEKPGQAPAQVPGPAAHVEPQRAVASSPSAAKLPATAPGPAVNGPRKPLAPPNARGAAVQPAARDPEADFGITQFVTPGKSADDTADRDRTGLGDNNLRIEKQTDKLRSDKRAPEQKQSPDAAAKPDGQKSTKKNLSEELFEKPLF